MATYFAQSTNRNRDEVRVTLDMGIATSVFLKIYVIGIIVMTIIQLTHYRQRFSASLAAEEI
ncbi:hypothetical protein [Burkholderia ubonensis]|uniref:hypothetical protein n=1 Tax=Burkholderia ubonensis TaxID=101571 RepID=UPI000A0F5F5F|nr:hypothetical protein [Burkholderia ubonensis]